MALCFVFYRKKLTDYIKYPLAQSEGFSEERVEKPTAICY
jgi:hypothetical protein